MSQNTSQLIGIFLLSLLITTYLQSFHQPTPLKKIPTPITKIEQIKKLLLSEQAPSNKEVITLENDDIIITINPQGGSVQEVILKKHKNQNKQPLTLLNKHNSKITLLLPTQEGVQNTKDILFVPQQTTGQKLILTHTDESNTGPQITYTYMLPQKGHQLQLQIETNELNNETNTNAQIIWYQQLTKFEKDTPLSEKHCYLQYHQANNKTIYIGTKSKEEKTIQQPISWASNKQRFFTKALIAPPNTPFSSITYTTQPNTKKDPNNIMETALELHIPLKALQNKDTLTFYFGPNTLTDLAGVAPKFSDNLYLGIPLIKPINTHLIAPAIEQLYLYTGNYIWALIILIILLKLLGIYFSYQSYITNIKKSALKPLVEKMKEKYGDDAGGKQQAQLAELHLYSEMGIMSPFSKSNIGAGVAQIVLFVSMINFVPSFIGFRQVPFLWIKDIAGYDDFIKLPFYIWPLGNHISPLAILMTASFTIPRFFSKQEKLSTEKQILHYTFPIILLSVFNNFAAAFCIYRITADMIDQLLKLTFLVFVSKDKHIASMQLDKKNITLVTQPRAILRKKRNKH